jgi:hypothetical protein
MISFVSIIGPSDITMSDFVSKYQTKISEAMDNPNTHFLISDQSGCGLTALKYLIKRKYQKCTIYHLGDKPKVSFNFQTKSGFSSYIEINECLQQDANIIINGSVSV